MALGVMNVLHASDTLPNFSGQVIGNGRYLLLNAIGSGSFGVVYRALDIKSDPLSPTYHAVKCLSKTELTTDQLLSQKRETRILQMMSGLPHIVALHNIVDEDHYLYLIMELCSGGDLYQAITRSRVYFHNDDLLKTAILQLLDGVQSCHEKGIYHRDIKPENILCNEEGLDLRIIDFGLATRNRLCHDFGCGSAQYMSPECIGKERIGRQYSALHTDIWSIGVVIVNMVTGRNPWRKAHSSDLVYSEFLSDPAGALRKMFPISSGFNDLLCKIFSLDPTRRPHIASLRQAITDLRTFYMSSDELVEASDAALLAARHIFPQNDTSIFGDYASDSTLAESDSGLSIQAAMDAILAGWDVFDSNDSEILALAEWGSVPPFRSSSGNNGKCLPVQLVLPDPEETGLVGDSSELSVPDSPGPITPQTHADITVGSLKDIPEMFSLAEPSIACDFVPPTAKVPVQHSPEIAISEDIPRIWQLSD